jgi:hypothetical protein
VTTGVQDSGLAGPHMDGASARVVRPGRHRYLPIALVAFVVGCNLVALRAETLAAPRPSDAPAHLSWIRWAEHRIEAEHSPLDGWYPDLSLGAPQFHQYQSLPHIAGGALATVFGAADVQRWILYLLLCTWPVSVFLMMLMLGFDRWTSATTAALSPLLSSSTSFGYELSSYLFHGYGLWTQLFGMWLLPVTMGLTWRAIDRGRGYAPAALMLALTVCCHLFTGYVAFLWVAVVVVAGGRHLLTRVGRAAVVSAGALLATTWLLVPTFLDLRWFDQGHVLATGRRDSIGAGQVLDALVHGKLFDFGRTHLPILTILMLVGLAVSLARARSEVRYRLVVVFFLLNLALLFGRPTWGPVLDLFPGLDHLFLHRFIAPVQLGGLVLAGIGTCTAARALSRFARAHVHAGPLGIGLIVGAVLAVLIAPSIVGRLRYASRDASLIREERSSLHGETADVGRLLAKARDIGGGRVFAGSLIDGGENFRAGVVPVYQLITTFGAPNVGYYGRVGSLSTDTELFFDPRRVELYDLYGVRFLILPKGMDPPTTATRVERRGRFVLWEVGTGGYLHVYDTVGPAIHADQAELPARTAGYVRSSLPARHVTRPIAFDGDAAARPTATRDSLPPGTPGTVRGETDRPDDGVYSGTVKMARRAVVVLSASYHGRWTVTVDGRPAGTQMVAPSLVGVEVGPGTHRVAFVYEPVPGELYALLFALGAAALVALAVLDVRRARQARSQSLVQGDASTVPVVLS